MTDEKAIAAPKPNLLESSSGWTMDAVAGVVTGLCVVILSVSFAALIFGGTLKEYLPAGIMIALVTAAVSLIVIACFSSFRGIIGIPQDRTAPIIALMASSIAVIMAERPTKEIFATVLVAMAITAALCGLALMLVGAFKVGRIVRFVPYPVIGGFLAGTGWLLATGAIGVMTGTNWEEQPLASYFTFDMMVCWIPGLIMALIMLVTSRLVRSGLVMPLVLVASLGAFYLFIGVRGISIAEAREDLGLLITMIPTKANGDGLGYWVASKADYGVILRQAGKIASILFLSIMSILLNSSALEMDTRQDVDADRELKSAGIANLLISAFGGLTCFQSLSLTTLGHRIGGRSRVMGVTAGLLCLAALFVGTDLISYLPRPVLGGLLMFLGLIFLSEWVYDGIKRMPRLDYLLVLVILVVVACFGYLPGVCAGIMLAALMFVVRYSRLTTIRSHFTGRDVQSNVDRAPGLQTLIRRQGSRTHILRLQGFIFFGTATVIYEKASHIVETEEEPPKYLVLDFYHVDGLDYSAINIFKRLSQLLKDKSVRLIFSNCSPVILRQLAEVLESNDALSFPDLDRSMEWCEKSFLNSCPETMEIIRNSLRLMLKSIFSSEEDVETFITYLEPHTAQKGDYLIRQGDEGDDLYFVEKGQVSVFLEIDGKPSVRLRTMLEGCIVGEVGLYCGSKRNASVISDTDTTYYRFTKEGLQALEKGHPELAATFSREMAALLAHRLTAANNALTTLAK